MLKDRKAYEKKLDAQLAQWKAEIDVLKAKAKRTEVDANLAEQDEVGGSEDLCGDGNEDFLWPAPGL
jgi:hypothetical protein